jgi:UDP-N-acetylmuramate--alanine ligase
MRINGHKIEKVYMVGIKGVAMTSLAIYLSEGGCEVTGSDIASEFPTDEILNNLNIKILPGFQDKNIINNKPDMVIYTGAHSGRLNKEVQAAQKLEIPCFPHGKALGFIMNGTRQLSIAGCHGKTTTSGLVATILNSASLSPSWAIGSGIIHGLGFPGHYGQGKWFVAEADEYCTEPGFDITPRMNWQQPEIAIITNIDFDHPDVYRNIDEVKNAYQQFINQSRNLKVLIKNSDDENSKFLNPAGQKIISVGFSQKADIQIKDMNYQNQMTVFSLISNNSKAEDFEMKISGKHNVINASMAIVAAHEVGIPWNLIKTGLIKFQGTKRRFEEIAKMRKVTFYDDYAHHPTEISATLSAAHILFPNRRIIVIFQPHTFSRTKSLLVDFAAAFKLSDDVIITDIYASAREKKDTSVSSEKLVELSRINHTKTQYIGDWHDIPKYLKRNLIQDEIVIFMGAGDIYNWEKDVIKSLIS